jgi:predicted anti-sigma-YlaC factor YlaD
VGQGEGTDEYPIGGCTAVAQAAEFDQALAAYALALEPEDVSWLPPGLLAHHLTECESCRGRLKGHTEVAADLALSAPPRRLPAHVSRNILGTVLLVVMPEDSATGAQGP